MTLKAGCKKLRLVGLGLFFVFVLLLFNTNLCSVPINSHNAAIAINHTP